MFSSSSFATTVSTVAVVVVGGDADVDGCGGGPTRNGLRLLLFGPKDDFLSNVKLDGMIVLVVVLVVVEIDDDATAGAAVKDDRSNCVVVV